MFSILDFLPVFVIVSVFTMLVMVSYIFFSIRKMGYHQKDFVSFISAQRDKYEKQIINANNVLMSDGLRFTDVNRLVFTETSEDLNVLTTVPNNSFYDKLGLDLDKIQVEDGTIACLMPFNNTYKSLYETIKETCEGAHYLCRRSDEDYHPDDILRHTVSMILHSQLIIAVLDGRNPNVYYEIGLAHSLGKMVLLLSNVENITNVPFDIHNKRVILYKGNRSLKRELTKCLSQIQYNEGRGEAKDTTNN